MASSTGSSADPRFARHALLPGWRQDQLADATVVILGVGALGNHVAQALALAGVGRFVLCDPDRIEASNLSRTPLFRPDHVGAFKVDAASESLRESAPGVRVSARPHPLLQGVGLAELRDASLVLGCLDSRRARLELAELCGLVRAKWIDGATGPWSGEVRMYLDPDGPCFACGLDRDDDAARDHRTSCAEVVPEAPAGAAAPLAAVVGALMSVQAVRFLMGLEVPKGVLLFDAPSGTSTPVAQRRDPECPNHRPLPQARLVPIASSATVRQLLAALGPGAVPLARSSFQSECPRCDALTLGIRADQACSACGATMHPSVRRELTTAPADATLADLGVPPRDILAFRQGGQLACAELNEGPEA